MQYDIYRQKIKKRADFLAKLYKYMALIIISISIFAIASTATLAAKGAIILDGDCPAEVTYGQTVQYKSNAFLASVRYEYRAEGADEWMTETPTRVGVYSVRSVAKSILGRARYGKEQRFEIKPKEIMFHITSNSLTYGDIPAVSVELEYGDTFECDFLYDDISLPHTDVCVDMGSISIINDKGEDSSENYRIIDTPKSEIDILPRPITVIVNSASKIYDNKVLNCGEWNDTELDLAFNDTLLAVNSNDWPSITDVGTAYNVTQFKVISEDGGKDVTGQYSMTVIKGSLTIEKKKISISTGSGESVYSAEAYKNPEFSIINAEDQAFLAEQGHSLIVKTATTITDCGTVENMLVFEVVNRNGGRLGPDGKELKDNYNFFHENVGSLTVMPRPITFQTQTDSVIYDAQEHTFDEVSVVESEEYPYIEGHYHSISGMDAFTNAGTYYNLCQINMIDEYGNDITSNYDIEIIYGTVTIHKREIYLGATQEQCKYTGKIPVFENENDFEVFGLVDGHKVSTASYTVSSADVGVYDVIYGTTLICDADGMDVSANYTVAYVSETFEITKRNLELCSQGDIWEYDGDTHRCGDYEISLDGLAEDQTLYALVIGEITDVGTVPNIFDESATRITDADGRDVTFNYNITYNTSYLNVTPRSIIVTAGSSSWVYDGYAHTHKDFTVDNLVEGHTASAELIGEITYVSQSPVSNHILENSVRIKNGEVDVTHNYTIVKSIDGTLEITPRKITIETGAGVWEFDGKTHTEDSLNIVSGSLAEGEEIAEYHLSGSITYVGECANTVSKLVICNADSMDTTDNYDITYINGILMVKKREIHIKVTDAVLTYNGHNPIIEYIYSDPGEENHVCEVVGEKQLVDGHVITRVSSTGVDCDGELGDYPLTIIPSDNIEHGIIIRDGNGEDGVIVTENYELVIEEGTLSIIKRKLYIKAQDMTAATGNAFIYNATSPVHGNYLLISKGDGLLAEFGHELEVENAVLGGYADVGTYDSTLKGWSVIDHNGDDASRYYELVEYTPAKIEIVKRSISLQVSFGSVVYDGEEHSNKEVIITSLLKPVDGHRIEAPVNGVFVDAGVYLNEIDAENTRIYDEENVDVSHNYDISTKSGIYVIEQREITITSQGASIKYDGMEHSFSGYEITDGSLIDGDVLTVNFANTTFCDAGIYENTITGFVINNKGTLLTDNSGNYNVTLVFGMIEITPRAIWISTGDGEWEYDGVNHSIPNWSADIEALVTGHTLVQNGSAVEIKDVGTKQNYVSISILDADGRNVTHNYEFEEDFGMLTVTPRKVTITVLAQRDQYYNDTIPQFDLLASEEYGRVDRLVPGHTLHNLYVGAVNCPYGDVGTYSLDLIDKQGIYVLDENGEYVNKGNYEFEFVTDGATVTILPCVLTLKPSNIVYVYDGDLPVISYREMVEEHDFLSYMDINATITAEFSDVGVWNGIFDRDHTVITNGGRDVTHNFEFKYTPGDITIEICKREIKVWIFDDTWVYDGKEHLFPTDKVGYSMQCINSASDQALCAGHSWGELDYMELKLDYGVIDVGTYVDIVVPSVDEKILDAQGKDVTRNYSISYDLGDVVVTPYRLVITSADGAWEYDDKYHSANEVNYLSLPEGSRDIVNVMIDNAVREVAWENGEVVGVPNSIGRVEITRDGKDVSSNYDIELSEGVLTITPRSISIASGSLVVEYDGKPHSLPDHFISVGELVPTHTIFFDNHAEYVDVVENGVNSANISIKSDDGRDVSSNYIIEADFGSITVTKRSLYIASQSFEIEYMGAKPMFYDKHGEVVGLLDGHTLSTVMTVDSYGAEVGEHNTYFLKNSTAVTDGNGVNVTSNYDITYETGKVKVIPRQIVVTPQDVIYEYDGTVHEFVDVKVENIIEGHTVSVSLDAPGYVGNVGTYELCVNEMSVKVYDDKGNDVTANYESKADARATLIVKARNVIISAASDEWEYDGNDHSNFNYTSQGLVNGHTVNAVLYKTISQVSGAVKNSFREELTVITDSQGNDVTANYKLIHKSGYIEITPKPIKIKTMDAETVYNGEMFYNQEYVIESGLLSGHRAEIFLIGVKDVKEGGYENSVDLEKSRIYDAEGNDVTANYTFTGEYGRLVINPRPLKVITGSQSFVYDGSAHLYAQAEAKLDTEYGLVSGHQISGMYCKEFINVSDSGDNIMEVEIRDQNAYDVTGNYDIEYEYGTITITKRTLHLTPVQTENSTNDEPHIPRQAVMSHESIDVLTANGLVLDVEVYIVDEITGVGIYTSRIGNVVLRDANGNAVSDENYDVVKYDGEYVVKDRVIKIMLMKNVKEYDGQAITYREGQWIVICPDGFTAQVDLDISRIDAGSLTFTELNASKASYIKSFTVTDTLTGEDVTSQYTYDDFTFASFTDSDEIIVINKRRITVEAVSDVHEYNGEPYANNKVEITQGTLADGHTYTASTTVFDEEVVSMQTFTNDVTEFIVTDADGNNITHNYEIIRKSGTMTITPASN